jgi:hypothetical protein
MRHWQFTRNRLNHDCLRNDMYLRLARYRNFLLGRIAVTEEEEWIPSAREWEILFTEIADLVKDFPVQMSPQVLFDEFPLCHCEASVRDWLMEAIHGAWLKKFRVESLVDQAAESLHSARQAYLEFQEIQVREIRLQDASDLIHALERFQTEVAALSTAIGLFPDQVLPP